MINEQGVVSHLDSSTRDSLAKKASLLNVQSGQIRHCRERELTLFTDHQARRFKTLNLPQFMDWIDRQLDFALIVRCHFQMNEIREERQDIRDVTMLPSEHMAHPLDSNRDRFQFLETKGAQVRGGSSDVYGGVGRNAMLMCFSVLKLASLTRTSWKLG